MSHRERERDKGVEEKIQHVPAQTSQTSAAPVGEWSGAETRWVFNTTTSLTHCYLWIKTGKKRKVNYSSFKFSKINLKKKLNLEETVASGKKTNKS